MLCAIIAHTIEISRSVFVGYDALINSPVQPDYLKALSYFTRIKKLRTDVNLLDKYKGAVSIERKLMDIEIERRKYVFNMTVKKWQNTMVFNSLKAWKQFVSMNKVCLYTVDQ